MLDRLVRRAVLAEADRIVGQHIDHPHAHQRRQPDRPAGIVGEDKERPAIGDAPAVHRDPVHRRGHAVLADAVVDIAPAAIGGIEDAEPLGQRVVRSGEVGRAAQRLGYGRVDHLEHHLRRLARRDLGRRLRLRLAERAIARPRASSAARRRSPARTRRACPTAACRAAPPRPSAPLRRGRRSRAIRRGSRRAPRTADTASRRSRGPWRSPRRRAASRARPWCPAWSARRSRCACGRRSSPAGRSPSPRPAPGRCRRGRARRTRAPTSRRRRSAPSGRSRRRGSPCRRSRCRCRPT